MTLRIEGVRSSNLLSSTSTPVFLGVVNRRGVRRDPLDPGLTLVGGMAQTEIPGLTRYKQGDLADVDGGTGSNRQPIEIHRARTPSFWPVFSSSDAAEARVSVTPGRVLGLVRLPRAPR